MRTYLLEPKHQSSIQHKKHCKHLYVPIPKAYNASLYFIATCFLAVLLKYADECRKDMQALTTNQQCSDVENKRLSRKNKRVAHSFDCFRQCLLCFERFYNGRIIHERMCSKGSEWQVGINNLEHWETAYSQTTDHVLNLHGKGKANKEGQNRGWDITHV